MRGRVTLLGVDEVWELGRITQEEYWCVVCNHIPVALFGTELDRETSRVACTYEDSDLVAVLVLRMNHRDYWQSKLCPETQVRCE